MTVTINGFERATANDQVMSTELPDGGSVLLDLSTELYFGLNDVGTMVWSGVKGGSTFAAIVDRIVADYGVEASTVAADVEDVVLQLVERGLVSLGAQPVTADE